ncbi:hypothetical protein [Streptomyces sp. NPDC051704]|uniref:hypothetical protein n=1 Tax=Streptomyces sp. NPDC051704 TaxID=3365671 RepID=UPI003797D040
MKRPKTDHTGAVAELHAAGCMPEEEYPGRTSLPWKVRCVRKQCPGHETPFPVYLSYIRNPVYGGAGCPDCRKQRRADERRADMINRGRVLPRESISDVKQPVSGWCMRCWKEVTKPRLDNIRSGQGGCEHCGGKARFPDETARRLARAWGYEPDPDIPYQNDATKWPGRCLAKNHFCDPILNSRFRSGPCETCADHGFKPDRPALLYVVIKSTLAAAKVGICEDSPRNTRLAEHRRNGWTLLYELSYPQGADARAREKATVESWRARGWEPVLDGKLAYDGYKETVSLRSISAEGIWAEIVRAEATESGRRP